MHQYAPEPQERTKATSQPRIGHAISDFYGGNERPSLLMHNGSRVHGRGNQLYNRPPAIGSSAPSGQNGLRPLARPSTAPVRSRDIAASPADERYAASLADVLPARRTPPAEEFELRHTLPSALSSPKEVRPASASPAAAASRNVARQRLNRTFYSSCFNRVPSRFIKSNYSHEQTLERALSSTRSEAPHELGDPSSAVIKSLDMPDRYRPIRELPLRFQSAEVQDRPVARQHPLYRTSAHDIGLRPPAQHELPRVYYSPDYSFTKTFVAGAKREGAGLDTSIKNPPLWEQHNYGFV